MGKIMARTKDKITTNSDGTLDTMRVAFIRSSNQFLGTWTHIRAKNVNVSLSTIYDRNWFEYWYDNISHYVEGSIMRIQIMG